MRYRRTPRLIKYDKYDRDFFTATFDGCTVTGNNKGISFRFNFRNIRYMYGIKIADYTWFDDIKAFRDLNLKVGEIVTFKARPVDAALFDASRRYGLSSPDLYLRLMNPTKAIKLTCPVKQCMPEDNIENGICRVHVNFK